MRLKIKICGMREPGNIREVAGIRPDLMGFIFYQASPRYAEGMLNPGILEQLSPVVKKTAVFVNADLHEILGIISKYSIDTVQLHGDEQPELCRQLQTKGIQIIKSFNLNNNSNFKNCAKFINCTNFFLFDSTTHGYGGSGHKFNWEIIDNYDLGHPFFISGGIAPGDESRLLEISNPAFYGIDLNSRFEIEPGLKNIDTLKKFVLSIRYKKISV